MSKDPKWLQHAGEKIKKSGTKGLLHRKLHIPEDEKIPMKRINAELRKRGLDVKTRHELQFAKNARQATAGYEPQIQSLIAWASANGVEVIGEAKHVLAPELRGTLDVYALGLHWVLREDKRDFNESSTRRRWEGQIGIAGWTKNVASAVLMARDGELTLDVNIDAVNVVKQTKIHGNSKSDLQKLLEHASKKLRAKLKLAETEKA